MFKVIPDFPDYSISDSGVLVSRKGVNERILSPYVVSNLGGYDGYLQVNLSKKGSPKVKRYIHQLVLLTFVGPKPFPEAVCRHLDGNPHNNDLSNLCWGTRKENTHDSIAHGTVARGERNGRSKLTKKDVLAIIELIGTNITQTEIARRYGVNQVQISNIAIGKTWKHIPK